MRQKKLILVRRAAKEKTHINETRLSTLKRQKVKNEAKPKKTMGVGLHFGRSQEEREKILLFHMYLKTFMAGIIQSSCLQ